MAKEHSIKRPLFWITGNYYDCQQRWNDILNHAKDANVVVLEGSGGAADPHAAKASNIITLLRNKDMFDDRPRIIKLKGLPDDYILISDYLNLVCGSNILVIDGPIGYKTGSSRGEGRFNSAKASKFYKRFAEEGRVFEYPIEATNDRQAKDWVCRVATEHNRKITAEAVDLIVQHRGRNLDVLYGDLSLLMDYQTKPTITIDDVKEICIPVFLRTVWDLVDAIDQQDYNSAIEHMQRFYSVAGSEVGTSFYGDIQQLLGALQHHFSFLMYIRKCGRLTYDAVSDAVSGVKKRTKVDDKWVWKDDAYSSAFIYNVIRKPAVQKILDWPNGRLERISLDLYRTSFVCRTKYSGDEDGLKLALDTFVMTACGRLDPNRSAQLKGYRRWTGRILGD